jgi:hypothetical protein
MDNYELKTEPKARRKPVIWNILTILVLLGTCYLAYYFLAIFINPNSNHNPFPPKPLPTRYQTATSTSTPIPLPATWTPTQTIAPLPSRTKAPTWTSVKLVITPTITLTHTATPIVDTATITPTAMPVTANISYAASSTIHPESACNWMGVGGKVVDTNNKPLLFQTAQLGGSLNGTTISDIVLSGSNPAFGTSGFEFKKLANNPIASTHTLWIQLFDNNGKPLSDKIYFDTFMECDRNLVTILFTKTR